MNLWGRYNRFSRSRTFRFEQLGQDALSLIANLGFTLFVLGVLIFTLIAATYEPEDPLFHPSTKMTTFLISTSNATFASDVSVVKTGEDFMSTNQTEFANFVNMTDIETIRTDKVENADIASGIITDESTGGCEGPVNCKDPELFYLMMKTTIEKYVDIHFYKFGKPVRGASDSTCDMAWRFRPKEGKTASFYKDYRRFEISRTENCTYTVNSIGEYHSGVNARKKKGWKQSKQRQEVAVLPVFGEVVNDSLSIESENSFTKGKYLIYSGGGDRCKSMNHYLWSFLCSLGEAQYLNRTLVMDLTICLNSMYSNTKQDEEGKDFRFYFDYEHLKEAADVLDQAQFWEDWEKWHKKHNLKIHLVEDLKTTPSKLAEVKKSVIMRKFGSVEPDNYWYRVCEGETESVIQRPWHLLWKSKRLMDIVTSIASKLEWDYDAVHVERGEKARNKQQWPNLEADTAGGALAATLAGKIQERRKVYVATNEEDLSVFDPLKDKYEVHFLKEYEQMWSESSEWYIETMKLNKGLPVEFDGYMKVSVDTEVFLRGKNQIETFNDLTNDCKDGVNTCNAATS